MVLNPQVQIIRAAQKVGKSLPPGVCPPGFSPISAELLQSIVQRIVVGAAPEKVILFGSYARGNPNSDSDLDLLVIMKTEERFTDRVLAISRLLRPRPFPMDILVRTPGEITSALMSKDRFIQDILAEGIVLYERPTLPSPVG
jgi:predicted nucleotidyltransferase